MGMAEIAVALWDGHYRHNPANPKWANRDRFLLSNGHGSMLHYSLLHLTGYAVTMDDLKSFRQLHSKTPGHPEVDITPGVETTTGPLGQGIANAVGMALSEYLLAAEFNKPGHDVVDHYTYAFIGDGCLMEGISHEVCSLAGTLGLNKLIALYDDNGISIDGKVEGWFTDDTPKRFDSYGWNVIPDVDGHDVAAVDAALAQARKSDKPTLICCKTVIGKGSPNLQGGDKVHGAALGDKEVAARARAPGLGFGAVRDPGQCLHLVGRQAEGRHHRGGVEHQFRRLPRGLPGGSGRTRAPHERRPAGQLRADPGRGDRRLRRQEGKHRHPQGQPERDPGAGAVAARIPRRLGRPDRFEPDQLERKHCAAFRQAGQPHQLRRARIRHERDHERHRPARRLHPVRRHLPDLLRLQPQRAAHGRADEAALDLRVHPRLDRPGRRRPDPPVGRARVVAAPDPEPGQLASVRHGRIGRRLGRRGQAQGRPVDPDLLAPEPAVPGTQRAADRRHRQAAATCCRTRRTRK